ncbi:hypothetical protein RB200_24280 [Streptomyces sp. PmtG]
MSAGPPLRLLALAVLLFSVALAHGASPENAGGHLATSAVTASGAPQQATDALAALATTDDRHGDHAPAHPSEQCASGQPVPTSAVTAVCLAVSVGQPHAPARAPVGRGPGEPTHGSASPAAVKSSVVQQV